jgi:hypothetical protein
MEVVVMFSGHVWKQGFFSKNERSLVITNLCFYIFKKKSKCLQPMTNRDAESHSNKKHLRSNQVAAKEGNSTDGVRRPCQQRGGLSAAQRAVSAKMLIAEDETKFLTC